MSYVIIVLLLICGCIVTETDVAFWGEQCSGAYLFVIAQGGDEFKEDSSMLWQKKTNLNKSEDKGKTI